MFSSADCNDPRPYLEVQIFGIVFFGLLDSGATQTIVGRLGWDKLSRLNVKTERCDSTVKMANGNKSSVLGIVSLPIDLNGKLRVIKCLIVLDLDVDIIFGIDFWRDMDLVSCFSKNSWKFRDELPSGQCFALQVLSEEQRAQVDRLVAGYFEKMGNDLGSAKGIEHVIDTGSHPPIKQRYYNVSPYLQKVIDQEVDEMLKLGVIEPCKSAWSSPVVLVKKKSGEYRFCIDFRKVNAVTRRDAYPIPYVSSILDRLRDARYLSSIDIKSAYWQIRLEENSKDKTAFTVPGKGLYRFCRMPFGLHNAAATFQRFIDNVLGAELETSVFCYLDDIIIATSTLQEHISVLSKVFERLISAGLTVNRDKCDFLKSELKYLGFVVDGNGLRTDPDKVKCMVEYPTPKNVKDVRRFVGMVSWYRRFIKGFATRVSPLTRLTRKNAKFVWTEECEAAFNDVKQCLVTTPILTCPDFSREFIIQTDASQVGLGAVLTQEFPEGEKVIGYASRSLTSQEMKYSTTELECLAVLYAIERFRPYIEGVKFKVITDHYSLLWLNKLQNPSGRLARWSLRLQGYDFDIIHRKGKMHCVPDAISRAVSYIQIEPENLDDWYRKLLRDVVDRPQDYPKWRVKDGRLYKFIAAGRPTLDEEMDWKMVIPKSLRSAVLQDAHDAPHAGHMGYYKTSKRVRESYYWPGMSNDILKYVRSCEVCKSQKPEQRRPYGHMSSRKVSRPWEIVSTDLIGPLPLSRSGNRYILVVTDLFTKYALLFPLRKATSQAVVKHIENDVFMIYGVPERLICDNGKQYVSSKFKKMVSSYGSTIVFNARYSPSANPTERVNRVIKTIIRSFIAKDQRTWDETLPKVGFALRTAVHEVTGYSPAYLNFGREIYVCGKRHQVENKEAPLEMENRDKLSEHMESVQGVFDEVRCRLKKAYKNSADQYNLRRRPLNLVDGQVVWKKNYTLSSAADYYAAKLAPRFSKCRVKHKVSTNVYELVDMEGRALGTWHIKDLKVEP